MMYDCGMGCMRDGGSFVCCGGCVGGGGWFG